MDNKDDIIRILKNDDRPSTIFMDGCIPEPKVYLGTSCLHIKKGSTVEIVIEDGANVTIRTERCGE